MTEKHECNKQIDITVLQTDSKWIKEELVKVVNKIDKMIDILTTGEGKISKLNKTIYGNGDREISMVYKVKEHDEYIISQKAQLKLMYIILTLIGAGNTYILFNLIFR